MGHPSLGYAHLASLAKICDKKTFGTILAASLRPLVQVNTPEKLLNLVLDRPMMSQEEKYKDRLWQALLPQE